MRDTIAAPKALPPQGKRRDIGGDCHDAERLLFGYQKAWLAKEKTVDDTDSTRSTPGTSH
jgi:hypothetical protein